MEVFGRCQLSKGNYEQVAQNATEYNTLSTSAKWLEDIFIADWLPIAACHGPEPTEDECLGWKVHPLIGGKFEIGNLQIFSMSVYQSIMGQLHRQLGQRPESTPPPTRSRLKFW